MGMLQGKAQNGDLNGHAVHSNDLTEGGMYFLLMLKHNLHFYSSFCIHEGANLYCKNNQLITIFANWYIFISG